MRPGRVLLHEQKMLGERQKKVETMLPLGTIISSMLSETDMQQEEGDRFVLCDGRSVIGSSYHHRTSQTASPDLRDQFLRGAGRTRSLGSFQSGATALPTMNFVGVTNLAGGHSHVLVSGEVGRGGSGSGENRHVRATTVEGGEHLHAISLTGGGDEETRPTNVAVNYYMCVN